MAVKKFILEEGAVPSEEQMRKVRAAAAKPVVLDEENPE